MSKIKKILTALFALFVLLGGYLFYSIEIYPQPYVRFSAPEAMAFKPINSLCLQNPQPMPMTRDKLRILVWNIHKGKDNGWQQVLKTFTPDTDLWLLQEVTDKQNLATDFSAEFPTALYTAAFAYLNERSGVKILARDMPDLYCASMEQEPWIIIPKVASAVRFFRENAQPLLVINVHLVNFELNPTNYRKQITTMMELISRHQGPIILAGDFNTWNSGRLALIDQLAQQAGLQEVRFTPDQRMRFLDNPLDHIFVRGFKINRALTMETDASDHNPLWVELEFDITQ